MIDEMMAKNASKFTNFELEVELKNIITNEDEGKITLVFYSDSTKSDYRKSYLINDIKGRVDFNRVMFSLGSNKKNYGLWLNKILTDKIKVKISVNESGFIRYVKVLDKSIKEQIAKSIFLDNIEGFELLSEEDRTFLMSLSLQELRKEFGND
jgi:hypothetical protein